MHAFVHMQHTDEELHLRQLRSSLPSAQSLRRSHLLRDDIHWPSDWQVNSSEPQAEQSQTNITLGTVQKPVKSTSQPTATKCNKFQAHEIHPPTSYTVF